MSDRGWKESFEIGGGLRDVAWVLKELVREGTIC